MKTGSGDITAAVTTTLGDLEQQSVTIMENVAGRFIHAIVIGVWLMIYEWRIGLISLAGLAVALIVYSLISKVGRKYAPAVRQPRLAWSLPFWNMCRASA